MAISTASLYVSMVGFIEQSKDDDEDDDDDDDDDARVT